MLLLLDETMMKLWPAPKAVQHPGGDRLSSTPQFFSIKINRSQLTLESLPTDLTPENIHQKAPQLNDHESKPHSPWLQ